jgi:hypothetical protein
MIGSKTARLGLGAGAVAFALLGAAACSGGGGDAAGGSASASPVSPSESALISLVADSMNRASTAGTVKVTGNVTTSTTGMMTLTGEEQFRPSLAMSLTDQVEGQTLSEVLVGSTVYLNYPQLASLLGGKQWGEINMSESLGSLGSLASLVDSAKTYNPTTQLEALVASGAVKLIGTHTVADKPTTHYEGVLNATQLLQETSAQGLTPGQFSSLVDEWKASGTTSENVDFYVGADGMPVWVKFVISTASSQTTTNMFLSDWGKPVQIGAPPASSVFDMTTELNSAVASAGAGASASSSVSPSPSG